MTSEYDAFGPWIYEVTTPDEVPPLFREQAPDLASCRYVIKVPRDIARRDATPQMDLYDYLVAAGPDALTVLSRRPTHVSSLTIPYDAISAIEHSVDLLDGRLTVHTTSEEPEVTIRYNGSSRELADALVTVVREQYLRGLPEPTKGQPAPAQALRLGDLGEDDVALVSEQHALRREEPTATLLAAHPRLVVPPRAGDGPGGLVTRVLHTAWPMSLQGALVCGDGREIQIIHRRHWWMRGRRPVHSVARTIFPISRVDSVTVREHEEYAEVRVVSLRLGSTVLDLPVPQGSDMESVLSRVQQLQQ